VTGPAEGFEGRIRPGHFTGVATVVCRLFTAVPATVAYFGAKDWQQTLVVKRMVCDLGLPVRVEVCPTVREADGLALSSRNAYLSAEDRRRAPVIHESLQRAAALWQAGEAVDTIEAAVRSMLESRGLVVDYAAVVAAESLQPLADASAPAIVLIAGRLGTTRLIDNLLLPARGANG
jgi:pantoate--beta-alanine ligase